MPPKSIIYILKLTLSDISPPIWRRVEVPADITLFRLAAVIVTAMGWSGGHLHQFRIGKKYYGIPHEDDLSESEDEREIFLRDILEKQGIKKFIFEYDFGDGWEHVIEFEETTERQKGIKYPRSTAGARCCPPEDCGGPPGYENFLEAIRDPEHSEHESMRQWIGGDFDPEAFDLEESADLADDVKSIEEQWEGSFIGD